MIENNRRRNNKPTEKASAVITRDASLHGWDPFLLHNQATLKLPEGNGRGSLFLIMQAEARTVRLALSAFSAILPPTMDVWVDNTSPQGAANKGSSETHHDVGAATDI
ncbi:putative retrotransposon hot spot (RHS) protein [Trypanosoma cruzi]|nr:putative retrotransposon hot spot (RHS) protein [Trypanosoma cruzi]